MIKLEHAQTGETIEVSSGTTFREPWRVKGIKENVDRQAENRERAAKLSTMLSGWGLPLSMTLTAIRWLLGKNCPYCQVGGEFLKLLEDGKIGEAECKELVIQVLNAKDQNDEVGLAALKGRLEELRNSI